MPLSVTDIHTPQACAVTCTPSSPPLRIREIAAVHPAFVGPVARVPGGNGVRPAR